MVELAVVGAVIGALALLAWPLLKRLRPRAQLTGSSTEIRAIVHRARQEALARGRDVAVIFYPAAATPSGTGRIIVVGDEDGGYMAGTPTGANLSYCTTTPSVTPELIDRMDLPSGVTIAVPPRAPAFPFPFNLVPAPANGCSFCTGSLPGGGARGAIKFDGRGRASFYADCGAPLSLPAGGSVALTSATLAGSRVLAVLPNGVLRSEKVE